MVDFGLWIRRGRRIYVDVMEISGKVVRTMGTRKHTSCRTRRRWYIGSVVRYDIVSRYVLLDLGAA